MNARCTAALTGRTGAATAVSGLRRLGRAKRRWAQTDANGNTKAYAANGDCPTSGFDARVVSVDAHVLTVDPRVVSVEPRGSWGQVLV